MASPSVDGWLCKKCQRFIKVKGGGQVTAKHHENGHLAQCKGAKGQHSLSTSEAEQQRELLQRALDELTAAVAALRTELEARQ